MQTIFVISNLGGHSDGMANSILNNDAEGVANSHQSLSAAKDQIEEFANHWGAEILGHGEDGGFAFSVDDPSMFIEDLQALKDHVMELSGYDMTIGVGTELKDAGLAFLYAKTNDNSEICVYDPSMEEELSQMGGEAEGNPEQEAYYDNQEQEPGEEESSEEENSDIQNEPSPEDEVGMPEGNTQGDILPEESEDGDFHEDEQPDMSMHPVNETDYKSDEGLDEQYNPTFDGAVSNTTNVAVSGDEGDAEFQDIGRVPYYPVSEINAGAPKEIVDEGEDQDPDHMAEESDTYDHEAEVDGEPENEEPLEESEETIDIPDSKEQEEMQRQQDEDTDANAEPGLAMDEENPDYTMDEDQDELDDNELVNPEEENIEQGSQEVGVPGTEMPEEEQVMGDGMEDDGEYEMAEDLANEEAIAEDLRNKIGAALDGFRSQREALMAMKEQAPELYESTVMLLQTLIEMSNLIFGEEEMGEEEMAEVPAEGMPLEDAPMETEEMPAEEEELPKQ